MQRHNKNVKEQFARAEKGEVINLTDMMISRETIIQNEDKERRRR